MQRQDTVTARSWPALIIVIGALLLLSACAENGAARSPYLNSRGAQLTSNGPLPPPSGPVHRLCGKCNYAHSGNGRYTPVTGDN